MDDLETRPELVHKERVARIVWAAHILHYLTNKRSLAELHPTDANVEEDEDCASDYQTERTAILTGPKTSVRQKFLDCISQLLSPSKGWDAVTAAAIRESEDNVEVDVARNDCFLSDNDGLDSKTIDFCRELERHLRATTEGKCFSIILTNKDNPEHLL